MVIFGTIDVENIGSGSSNINYSHAPQSPSKLPLKVKFRIFTSTIGISDLENIRTDTSNAQTSYFQKCRFSTAPAHTSPPPNQPYIYNFGVLSPYSASATSKTWELTPQPRKWFNSKNIDFSTIPTLTPPLHTTPKSKIFHFCVHIHHQRPRKHRNRLFKHANVLIPKMSIFYPPPPPPKTTPKFEI